MHRGLARLPKYTIRVQSMIIKQAGFHLVVYLDHLDESISIAPFIEVLFLHSFVDYFVANLALG